MPTVYFYLYISVRDEINKIERSLCNHGRRKMTLFNPFS